MLDHAAARRSFLLPLIAEASRDASGTGPDNTPRAPTNRAAPTNAHFNVEQFHIYL
jgi:hypothetical protein